MIDSAIIVSTITQTGTIVAACIAGAFSIKKMRKEQSETIQTTFDSHYSEALKEINVVKSDLSDIKSEINVVKVRVDGLAEKTDKHNNVIERTYKLEQAVADIKEDIAAVKGAWE